MKKLDQKILTQLAKKLPHKVYSKDCTEIYKGQIPFCAFIVYRGSIIKRKKKGGSSDDEKFGKGHIFGIRELERLISIDYDLFVTAGTTLLSLDKSALKEMTHQQDEISMALLGA